LLVMVRRQKWRLEWKGGGCTRVKEESETAQSVAFSLPVSSLARDDGRAWEGQDDEKSREGSDERSIRLSLQCCLSAAIEEQNRRRARAGTDKRGERKEKVLPPAWSRAAAAVKERESAPTREMRPAVSVREMGKKGNIRVAESKLEMLRNIVCSPALFSHLTEVEEKQREASRLFFSARSSYFDSLSQQQQEEIEGAMKDEDTEGCKLDATLLRHQQALVEGERMWAKDEEQLWRQQRDEFWSELARVKVGQTSNIREVHDGEAQRGGGEEKVGSLGVGNDGRSTVHSIATSVDGIAKRKGLDWAGWKGVVGSGGISCLVLFCDSTGRVVTPGMKAVEVLAESRVDPLFSSLSVQRSRALSHDCHLSSQVSSSLLHIISERSQSEEEFAQERGDAKLEEGSIYVTVHTTLASAGLQVLLYVCLASSDYIRF